MKHLTMLLLNALVWCAFAGAQVPMTVRTERLGGPRGLITTIAETQAIAVAVTITRLPNSRLYAVNMRGAHERLRSFVPKYYIWFLGGRISGYVHRLL